MIRHPWQVSAGVECLVEKVVESEAHWLNESQDVILNLLNRSCCKKLKWFNSSRIYSLRKMIMPNCSLTPSDWKSLLHSMISFPKNLDFVNLQGFVALLLAASSLTMYLQAVKR